MTKKGEVREESKTVPTICGWRGWPWARTRGPPAPVGKVRTQSFSWSCWLGSCAVCLLGAAGVRKASESRSVISESLWPHGLQHTRPSCPSPTPGVYSNSCPSSRWCHPAISSSVIPFSSCLQSQHQGLFKWVSSLHRGPKDWSFSFNISPFNELSGLISFRMDWLDLLAVQGTLKSLPQHHSSKASILRYSAFFIVQLSHPYVTSGKTIALMRRTFVSKIMSLLFNMLSSLAITFLPRSKCFFISWLQSPSAVILEPPKI